ALYKVEYVEKREDEKIWIGKAQFKSRILAENLRKVERVFPFIITIGKKLEEEAARQKDLLSQYYLEEIADIALSKVSSYLEKYIRKTYSTGQISRMSPGELADWPITQQRELFLLFGDKQNPIGVTLTENFLMIPRKSVSGVFFPTSIKFYSCKLCPRKNCHRRKAAYDENLAKIYIYGQNKHL
ncbi:vitamin B12 dependent methionine synthase, partial [Candidatus Aerophobetes bacterium]|nr:vitamin B12 dependent methionine synthase [Candidatus Aerophobetes bacterium]